MKEVRITLRSEDFAAASQSMIDLGLKFRVEPVVVERATPQEPAAASPRREVKRKAARVARRSGASKPARGADREASGADRLRAMVERNRLASGRAGDDLQTAAGETGRDADAEPPVGED